MRTLPGPRGALNCLTAATRAGLRSAYDFRPSHLPILLRTRSRARLKLGDGGRFLELSNGTEHLPDQDGRGRLLKEVLRSACGDQGNPEVLEVVMACQLNREVTDEPIQALHDDRPHAIACDPVPKPGRAVTGSEPRTAAS